MQKVRVTVAGKSIRRPIKKKLDDNKKKLLTLKGMSGAFLVLATSYAIAVIVFILEIYNCHIISKEKY